jgi:hypothetical protein
LGGGRIVSFAARPRDIARAPLAAKAAAAIGLTSENSGPPAVAIGLAAGSLALQRRAQ